MYVAGVDEAGRGPLAGPVFAAAVILPDDHSLVLADSKRLSPARRAVLCPQIRSRAVSWAVASASTAEIDELGIHHASLLAMARALRALRPEAGRGLVDGRFVPPGPVPCTPVVGGDASVPVISAASILAKVARDALMCELDRRYPGYGFARHKGYPTAAHRAALKALGPCAEHRRSFAPVRALLTGAA